MATFKSVSAYLVYVKQLVYESRATRNSEAIYLTREKSPREGRIFAESLNLRSGGTIRFHEHVVLTNIGEITRPIYSYGYQDNRISFRYDRDPFHHQPIIHEECHLHVNNLSSNSGDELRFKTHETNFEEIFLFIVSNFSNE